MHTYEQQLDRQTDWALKEGGMHFEGKSAFHQTLHKNTRRLDELGIPYAVAGGMALFTHGLRRFTEAVDILVTSEGLQAVHEHLEELGCVMPLLTDRKDPRDAEYGVRIEFLVAGDYPGDGKPKPVAFPDPTAASIERGEIRYLELARLIELKSASGMTNPGRLKNLADVQELIRVLRLPREFSARLDTFVRRKYEELWEAVQGMLSES
jgi:hypothetical protein